MVGEDAGQTWQAQRCCDGLLGTSGTVPCQKEFQLSPPAELQTHPGGGGTLSLSGPCSVHPLSKWLTVVVTAMWSVPDAAATLKPAGGHRR